MHVRFGMDVFHRIVFHGHCHFAFVCNTHTHVLARSHKVDQVADGTLCRKRSPPKTGLRTRRYKTSSMLWVFFSVTLVWTLILEIIACREETRLGSRTCSCMKLPSCGPFFSPPWALAKHYIALRTPVSPTLAPGRLRLCRAMMHSFRLCRPTLHGRPRHVVAKNQNHETNGKTNDKQNPRLVC